MTIEAKRVGRIDVWPSGADALSADTDESKRLNRMTIWPTSSAARSHTSLSDEGGGGGGGDYVAKAVHFDGAQILQSTSPYSGASSSIGIMSFWAKGDWSGSLNNDYFFYLIGNGTTIQSYPGVFGMQDLNTFAGQLNVNYSVGSIDGGWHHVLASWSTDHPSGEKEIVVYLDDVAVGTNNDVSNIVSAFEMALSGVTVSVCASDQDSPSTIGDFADFAVWLHVGATQSDNTVSLEDRRRFISDVGKPVDLSGAIIAFGSPEFLFSGDHTTFATNQGTGGAFTLTGTLTNATTSPSD